MYKVYIKQYNQSFVVDLIDLNDMRSLGFTEFRVIHQEFRPDIEKLVLEFASDLIERYEIQQRYITCCGKLTVENMVSVLKLERVILGYQDQASILTTHLFNEGI